jgi:membrane-associated phospholipid phosphatase
MNSIFDKLGFYGPLIMVGLNIYVIGTRLFHVLLFITYIAITILLNKQLKLWIMQPRPPDHASILDVQGEWGWGNLEYTGAEKYGMPSGHSMLMFFSLMYLWWNTQNVGYMIGGGFLTFLTLYQRWKYKKHTVSQLFVGAILGIILSGIAHIATKKWFSKMNYITPRVKSSLDNV